MSLTDLRDVSWGVLLPAALLLLIPILCAAYLCLARPRRGLLLAILLLPIYLTSESLLRFLANLFGGSQTVIPADILFVLVLGGFLLTRRAAQILREPGRYPIALGLLIFLTVALLSLVHSSALPLSLLALLAYAQLFVMTLAVEAVPEVPQDLQRITQYWMYSYAVVLGVGLFGVVSLWAGWDTFPVHSMQEIKATFRFPNQLSFFLAASLPVFFSLTFRGALSRRTRRLVLLSIPLALVLVWFCGSRSGLVSVVVAAATVGALHASRARVYVWAGLGFVILAASYITSTQTSSEGVRDNRARYTMFLDPRRRSLEAGFYENIDSTAISAFLADPLIGGGLGSVLNRDVQEDQPLEVHNIFVGILGQTGLLGMAACLITVGFAVHNLLQAGRLAVSPFVKELTAGALAALAGCFVHGLANFDWRTRYLWFLLAITTVVRMAAQWEFESAHSLNATADKEELRMSCPATTSVHFRS